MNPCVSNKSEPVLGTVQRDQSEFPSASFQIVPNVERGEPKFPRLPRINILGMRSILLAAVPGISNTTYVRALAIIFHG